MGTGPSVTIEVDRAETGGTFTNYDVIRGTVRLTVTSSISLNYVQVKLEGIAKTEMKIPRTNNGREHGRKRDRDGGRGRERDQILQDVHRVLYDTMIVFPPDNVRQVSNAREFTLTPGNYSYPFQFKLPLNNSCVKLLGITNKVLFSKQNFSLVLNNGNFNRGVLRNLAQQYVPVPGGGGGSSGPTKSQGYHVTSQLPPSLSGMADFASVKYFVKVTCKRSSFMKANLRSIDPFIFLPLDLDAHERFTPGDGEYREVFVRRGILFRDRIPEIVAVKVPKEKQQQALPPLPAQRRNRGILLRLIAPTFAPAPSGKPRSSSTPKRNVHEIESTDVNFSFESRFRYPAFLIPTKRPSFKLFLLTSVKPSKFSLQQYGSPDESNGLGVVYFQKLKVELLSTTTISVLENNGVSNEIHKGQHNEPILICNNTYQNLKLDLKNCTKLRSSSATSSSNVPQEIYELEIPRKYYDNCILPDYLAPSFKTCNISRRYTLAITAGFSSEKIYNLDDKAEAEKKIQYVTLDFSDIKVLSGLNMTSSLHSNASASSLTYRKSSTSSLPMVSDSKSKPHGVTPPEKDSIAYFNGQDDMSSIDQSPPPHDNDTSNLPTYDEVVRESSYQDHSEHYRARRRYQQHETYYNDLD